jgi:hypothetical protein
MRSTGGRGRVAHSFKTFKNPRTMRRAEACMAYGIWQVLGLSYSIALIWRYVGVATHSRQQLRHAMQSALSSQHSALSTLSTQHSAPQHLSTHSAFSTQPALSNQHLAPPHHSALSTTSSTQHSTFSTCELSTPALSTQHQLSALSIQHSALSTSTQHPSILALSTSALSMQHSALSIQQLHQQSAPP